MFYYYYFQYCVHLPRINTLDETNYDKMLSEKKVAEIINTNILHYHPDANNILIDDLYIRNDVDTIGFIVN